MPEAQIDCASPSITSVNTKVNTRTPGRGKKEPVAFEFHSSRAGEAGGGKS